MQKGVLEQAIGHERIVLVEGRSKRSEEDFCGRNDHNIMTIFPRSSEMKPGDYVSVKIKEASSITLKGIPV